VKIFGFSLAPLQAWWHTVGTKTPQVIKPKPQPVVPFYHEQLEALLEKYKELPKTERVADSISPHYSYIEPTEKQQVLLKRLHKLIGRYGFHLSSVEYFVQHDADERYNEDLTLHIRRIKKCIQP
jgi:hypothetical protein